MKLKCDEYVAVEPNVLLLVLDSVRAKNTSIHNHHSNTTPFLAEFAQTATCYRQARAPSTTSITSHASLFTGLHVNEHRITSSTAEAKSGATIFEYLNNKYDYRTGVFSENVWITDVDIGLNTGFGTIVGPQDIPYPEALNPRTFVSHEGAGNFIQYFKECLRDDQTVKGLANGVFTKLSSDYPRLVPNFVDSSSPGNLYADEFLNWVDNTQNNWAACVNLMDAHLPYKPQAEHDIWGDKSLHKIEDKAVDQWELHCGNDKWWRQKAREALYDGAIHQADSHVKRIVDGLKKRDVLDETLIIVTSDHGEGFGESSRIRPARIAGHNVSVHEVLLHVPLVVKYPGQKGGKIIDSVATLTKFPGVVKDVINGEPSSDGFVPDRPVVASSYRIEDDESLQERALRHCDDLSAFESPTHVVYEDGYPVRKYITWKDREATVEVRNAQDSYKVSDSGGRKVREIFESMEEKEIRMKGETAGNIDDETYEKLQDLGYL